MLYILSYTLPNASFNCKVLTNFLYLNKLFLVLFIICSTSKKGATRLSFANTKVFAHDLSRSFAYAHRRTRVCLSLVVEHAFSRVRN